MTRPRCSPVLLVNYTTYRLIFAYDLLAPTLSANPLAQARWASNLLPAPFPSPRCSCSSSKICPQTLMSPLEETPQIPTPTSGCKGLYYSPTGAQESRVSHPTLDDQKSCMTFLHQNRMNCGSIVCVGSCGIYTISSNSRVNILQTTLDVEVSSPCSHPHQSRGHLKNEDGRLISPMAQMRPRDGKPIFRHQ